MFVFLVVLDVVVVKLFFILVRSPKSLVRILLKQILEIYLSK